MSVGMVGLSPANRPWPRRNFGFSRRRLSPPFPGADSVAVDGARTFPVANSFAPLARGFVFSVFRDGGGGGEALAVAACFRRERYLFRFTHFLNGHLRILNNGQLGLRLWRQNWNLLRFGDGCFREDLFHCFFFNGLWDCAVLFVRSEVGLLLVFGDILALLRLLSVRGAEAATHLEFGSCEEVLGSNGYSCVVVNWNKTVLDVVAWLTSLVLKILMEK